MYAPTTFSQTLELDNKKAKELKRLAEDAQDKGDFYVALEIYKKIVMLDTANVEMQYKLAELLRYSRNYALAEKHYATVYKLNPTQYPLALFYLATMQKANNKYSEAKKNLEKFKKPVESRRRCSERIFRFSRHPTTGALRFKVKSEYKQAVQFTQTDQVLAGISGKEVNSV